MSSGRMKNGMRKQFGLPIFTIHSFLTRSESLKSNFMRKQPAFVSIFADFVPKFADMRI